MNKCQQIIKEFDRIQSKMKTVVINKGHSVGMTTFINKNQCFDEISFLDDVTTKRAILLTRAGGIAHNDLLFFGESFKAALREDVYFRRYRAIPAPRFDKKSKKKPPNFARFQNDFSNRRSHKKL